MVITLTPNIPYLTETYTLPMLAINPFMVEPQWTSPTLPIDQGVILSLHDFRDQQHDLILTVHTPSQTFTHTYSIAVVSQLQVPSTPNLVPSLKIKLDQNRQEQDIFYEDYLTATALSRRNKNGTMVEEDISTGLGIRIRGNSSRFWEKRPYRIRFNNQVSLFGMKSARNYILLANYIDRSHVRNSLTVLMSKFYQHSMYTLDYRFIDLFINNNYMGNYVLMERVEFSSNRLNIVPDLSKDDAGFMIELDYQVYIQNLGNENLQWFKLNNIPYNIKEPNPLGANYQQSQSTYIKNFYTDMRAALASKTNYLNYVDVDNWLDYFLIQEVTKNVDLDFGSVFMTKTTGGLLKHHPLWDFDLALGNANYFNYGPEGFISFDRSSNEANDLFALLMDISGMKTRFRDRILYFQTNVLPFLIQWMDDNQQAMATMMARNFEKYPMDVCNGWCPIPNELVNVTTIEQQFTYLKNYLTTRVTWMRSHI